MPILTQYLFFLTMNVLATVAQHAVIRALARVFLSRRESHQEVSADKSAASAAAHPIAQPVTDYGHASPSAISTALLVSSCTKLFPILLVIWPTEAREGDSFGFAFRATNYVGWAVLVNNIEALLILLDCGYVIATGLAVSGVLGRWVVEVWALNIAGLGGDTGPVGDVLAAFSVIRGWLSAG